MTLPIVGSISLGEAAVIVLALIALALMEVSLRSHGSSLLKLLFPNRFQRARSALVDQMVSGGTSRSSDLAFGAQLSDIDAAERADLLARAQTSRRAALQVLKDLRNERRELAANLSQLASGRLPTDYGPTQGEIEARATEVEVAIAEWERKLRVL